MRIYSSSAGSGKTFTLVKEYLMLCLNINKENDFQTIKNTLAITFTNNATKEMKNRILEYLKDIALTKEQKSEILKILLKESNYNKEQIIKRANKVLDYIFNNYHEFSIMTIDSFIQKMMRSFSSEMNIPINFELYLNENDIMEIIVDKILSQYNINEKISKNLKYLTYHEIESGLSWDIRNKIIRNANILQNKILLEPIELNKIFENYEKWIKTYSLLKNKLKSDGDFFFELKSEFEIEEGVIRKNIDSFFYKLKGNNISVDMINKTVKEFFNDPMIIFKKVKTHINKEVFISRLNEINIENTIKEFLKYKAIIKEIYYIILFYFIEEEIENYKNQNNILFLSDSLKKIRELFENAEREHQIIPFIYYKLWGTYSNYLLDEFQDTSIIQWQGLKPLIEDADAQGTVILVGDKKQAIYRWRGGDISIMENEEEKIDKEELKVLEYNFRSDGNIIEFNNIFFQGISDTCEEWKEKNIEQKLYDNKKENKGYIEFYQIKNTQNNYDNNIIEIINNSVNRGYLYSDICILVRKNKDIEQFIETFNNEHIPYIAPENLNLSSSQFVLFIIDLLNLFIDYTNKDNMTKILLSEFINANIEDIIKLRSQKQYDIKDFFSIMENTKGKEFKDKLQSIFDNRYRNSVYENIANIVCVFPNKNDFFVNTLLNKALEYAGEGGIETFLNNWEKKIKNAKIEMPDNMNAVKIMTIHKSKGLQFPIVILPSINWDKGFSKNNQEYMKVRFDNVDIYVKTSQGSESVFPIQYREAQSKSIQDNINLLYVAMTRAEHEIYAFSRKANDINDIVQKGLYSIKENLGNKINIEENNDVAIYSIGKKTINKNKKKNDNQYKIKDYSLNMWKNRIIVSDYRIQYEDESIVLGKVLHKYMELNKDFSYNRDLLIEIMQRSFINKIHLEKLENWIKNIVNNKELKNIVENNYSIKREIEIVEYKDRTYKGHILDLLAIKDNNAIIIDYKTGEFEGAHIEQVKEYKRIVEEMGYNTKGFILYVNGETREVK